MPKSIYTITNTINNDIYVGKTGNTIRNRWMGHLRSVRDGSHCHLHNAIRKYGSESFVIEAIYCTNDIDHHTVMERHFIRDYDSYANGYNMTIGGEGVIGLAPWNKGLKHSEETRRKISERALGKTPWNKGVPHSKESIEKMVASKQNISIETREKMSESGKGRIKTKETREKLSRAHKGKVFSDEHRKSLSISAKNRPTQQCPYCPKSGDRLNMQRWHFDNCKHKG